MKDIQPIGYKAYLVHKRYAVEKQPGGRIIVGRLKTYKNVNGKIVPVYVEIGNSKNEIQADIHKIFKNLEKAVDAIKSK